MSENTPSQREINEQNLPYFFGGASTFENCNTNSGNLSPKI
jgi:hypothetical protein